MRYEDTSAALLEAVPEARDPYAQLKDEWTGESPGPTIVFEDVLKPLLVSMTAKSPPEDLKRVFHFLEALAKDPDSRVNDLVAYALYDLVHDSGASRKAKRYMGSATRKISRRVERGEG